MTIIIDIVVSVKFVVGAAGANPIPGKLRTYSNAHTIIIVPPLLPLRTKIQLNSETTHLPQASAILSVPLVTFSERSKSPVDPVSPATYRKAVLQNETNMPESNEPPRQTTKASPANTEPKGSQLDEWYKTQETHEQLVVGEKTSRTFAKTLGFLEEIEEKVDGDDRGEENTRG
ncbi:hypothetical protein HO133_003796 [Letharia lupina]|uniref:Uncharacterized protein n=1 Tax=Letharia lupina TaxID=560253 RepID=A0A8H6CB56_9LECA|nr:uncharacterized protein HO133_003796 [Letharia lupina]KAF6219971.1 hypothetical protein HO133_003796 [Letharia lupina]